jgi:hypothetical protein
MAALGWTAVRVHGLTRGGYTEQVRGYARDKGGRCYREPTASRVQHIGLTNSMRPGATLSP